MIFITELQMDFWKLVSLMPVEDEWKIHIQYLQMIFLILHFAPSAQERG